MDRPASTSEEDRDFEAATSLLDDAQDGKMPGAESAKVGQTEPEGQHSWWAETKDRVVCEVNKRELKKHLQTYLPCTKWILGYKRHYLPTDLIAGLTVAIMAIPQTVSFASLAGLPSQYGLYSCIFPIFGYALFGGSKQLAVGPVALVSLLLGDGLSKLIPGAAANTDPNRPADPAAQQAYNQAAIQVSLLVAVIYLIMGAARLGYVTYLLSKPIISSFLTAGAIVISLSQVKFILGYDIPRGNLVHETLYHLWAGLPGLRWRELVMGATWLSLLYSMRYLSTKYRQLRWAGPIGPITIAVLSISTVWAFGLQRPGPDGRPAVAVVGTIPAGLPPLSVGQWLPLAGLPRLAVTAGLIAVVSLLESISIAKALAGADEEPLVPNQELFGLGFANLLGAMFSSYPSTGSFARSAVAKYAGAKSCLAGVVTAVVVGAALLVLTPLFRAMPMNALGAIVIVGVLALLDFGHAVLLFKVSRRDFAVWVACFLGSLFLGIDVGLGAGVGLTLLLLLWEAAFPEVALLGRALGGEVASHGSLPADVELAEGMVVLRLGGPLCFANFQHLRDAIAEQEAVADQSRAAVLWLVLDLGAVPWTDTTALDAVAGWLPEFRAAGMRLLLAGPAPRVQALMNACGLMQLLGDDAVFPSIAEAVRWCRQELLNGAAAGSSTVNNMHSSTATAATVENGQPTEPLSALLLPGQAGAAGSPLRWTAPWAEGSTP